MGTFGGVPFDICDVRTVDKVCAAKVLNGDGTVAEVVGMECMFKDARAGATKMVRKGAGTIGG